MPGMFRVAMAPYQAEPMDCAMDELGTESVVL